MANVGDIPENVDICLKFCGTCFTYPGIIRGTLFCARGKSNAPKGKSDAIALNVTSRRSTGVMVPIIALKVPAKNNKFFVDGAWFEDLTGAQWVPNPFSTQNCVVGV